MKTTDSLTLLIFNDLLARRIVPNRPTLARWMDREHDPFPQPIVLSEGREHSKSADKNGRPIRNRFSGRRVAWRAIDVEAWLERRAAAGNEGGSAA